MIFTSSRHCCCFCLQAGAYHPQSHIECANPLQRFTGCLARCCCCCWSMSYLTNLWPTENEWIDISISCGTSRSVFLLSADSASKLHSSDNTRSQWVQTEGLNSVYGSGSSGIWRIIIEVFKYRLLLYLVDDPLSCQSNRIYLWPSIYNQNYSRTISLVFSLHNSIFTKIWMQTPC